MMRILPLLVVMIKIPMMEMVAQAYASLKMAGNVIEATAPLFVEMDLSMAMRNVTM